MLKRFVLFSLMLMFFIPTSVFAHTGLKSSTPSKGENIAKEVKEITMQFNTDLGSLSTFDLTNNQGQKIKPEKVAVEGSDLKGTLAQPLANGEYTVHWKIIGTDSHPVEGNYVFTVNSAETVNPAPAAPETVKPEPAAAATPVEEKPLAEDNGTSLYVIIAAIFLGIVTSLLFRSRSRK
ncbi:MULTISPECIES: copper resistance protein CopC [unclassified Paenibacillus]|uniref:copper resistance CopC family protein n=1 Tax=unclassified Paenibacillus TaxID=185978 RepID=UPI001AE9D7DD|nr:MULTISPECIES: copper resistance protein CopC [unclassified Paenibacillus]MBP1156477.1 methionine-rich copper-binding protein CopC [Paenibacillus sp. PvP091]MBP1168137.1 methionine-rich copper-binding protein CopC [Paenibacillus sp. PvR098]MBP2439165.1 methionine-rich copper-binding protein CopC [Paenibacillus sp. PvP052]